jgi:hypothetical protein
MATWLSQNKVIGMLLGKLSSDKRPLSQINSQAADVIARYSDLALERAMTCCFLLRQETRLPPTNIQ